MVMSLFVVAALLGAVGTASAGVTRHWDHSADLSPDYRLLWTVAGQEITFEVQVHTLGYVGLGFSRDGNMAGSDIVLGWVDQGQVYFQDRHVKKGIDREPAVDPSQDYQLLLGYENATHTVLRFRRRLDTCDLSHDLPITNDTMRVIWAYHTSEPVGGAVAPGSLPPHGTTMRGTKSLFLGQRVNQEAPLPRGDIDIRVWELRNPEVELPQGEDTLYWCRVFRLPELAKKQHMIRYEPLLDHESSGPYMHHVILYECQGGTPDLETMSKERGRPCYQPDSPPLSCNTVVATWARGSEGFSFPPEAGYPMDSSMNRFYMMETHYNNPQAAPDALYSGGGMVDSSGLRLYYTPTLRRYDAGVLSVGIDPNWRHIIPPGQARVVSEGHCIGECTRQAFPNGGISMFAVIMRTHMIGKQVRLRQIRNGNEQPPISADSNVDFNYQEYRRLSAPVKVLPGDHLIAECTYNSSDRAAITLGGLTTREETCLVFALYYPRQRELTSCHSLPSLPTVLHSLGIQELHPGSNPVRIASPPELAGMTLESRLVSYDWENQFDSFQEATRKGSFKPLCWTAKPALLPGTEFIEAHYPNITRPWRAPVQCGHRTHYVTEPETAVPGVGPHIEDNHIEGAARSKVSRSSSGTQGETLGLSGARSRHTTYQAVLFTAIPWMVLALQRLL